MFEGWEFAVGDCMSVIAFSFSIRVKHTVSS